jgi:hypothetical protein
MEINFLVNWCTRGTVCCASYFVNTSTCNEDRFGSQSTRTDLILDSTLYICQHANLLKRRTIKCDNVTDNNKTNCQLTIVKGNIKSRIKYYLFKKIFQFFCRLINTVQAFVVWASWSLRSILFLLQVSRYLCRGKKCYVMRLGDMVR